MRLIFLGAPASGKGTQAKRLAAEEGIPHISTGDILRTAVKAGTRLGRAAKCYMERGALVPDDIMIGIIQERLQQDDSAAGFILDGFPRTIAQAEELARLLTAMGTPLDYVLNMEVPVEEILRRMSGRLICQNCGAMFNVHLNPPQVEGRCDCCNGPLIQRVDDRAETVHERLAIYRERTQPLIKYYRARGLLKIIDGTGSPDDVAKRIMEAISE